MEGEAGVGGYGDSSYPFCAHIQYPVLALSVSSLSLFELGCFLGGNFPFKASVEMEMQKTFWTGKIRHLSRALALH